MPSNHSFTRRTAAVGVATLAAAAISTGLSTVGAAAAGDGHTRQAPRTGALAASALRAVEAHPQAVRACSWTATGPDTSG